MGPIYKEYMLSTLLGEIRRPTDKVLLVPNPYLDTGMDMELNLKRHHIVFPGDGIGNPLKAEGIIFVYLPLLLKAENVIQVNPIERL